MKLYPIFLALIVSISAAHCQAQESLLSGTNAKKMALGAAVIAGASYAGYQLFKFGYQKFQEYREDYILNATVESITTALYPLRLVQTLPAEEKEKILRRKAQLINQRKRIIAQLEEIIATNNVGLSQTHQEALKNQVAAIKLAFKAIDLFRKDNPYETDYLVPSYLDSITENAVVKGIILNLKPDCECTRQDTIEKEKSAARKAKLIAKLKTKALDSASQMLMPLLVTLAKI